jgi:hypothetical protein
MRVCTNDETWFLVMRNECYGRYWEEWRREAYLGKRAGRMATD